MCTTPMDTESQPNLHDLCIPPPYRSADLDQVLLIILALIDLKPQIVILGQKNAGHISKTKLVTKKMLFHAAYVSTSLL